MIRYLLTRMPVALAGFALLICITSCRPAEAGEPELLRVGVARLTHGHVGDVFESNRSGKVRIVGIFEPDRELAHKYAARFGLADELFFNDLAEMIGKTSPEVVTAYGSIHEHLGVVEACAPRGVHVMVEKPLAYSLDHGLAIEALAQKHGIQVITNYATTWFPSFRAAHDLIRERKQLGEIRKVVIHDGHRGPREIGCSPEFLNWLTDPEQNGGGALIDFGCYGAGLMAWLMEGALPVSVTAVTQQLKPEVYPLVDDEATIILTYPGAQAIIQASWNWPFDRKDMYVYCRNGYVFAPDSRTLTARLDPGEPERTQTLEPLAAPFDDAFSYLTAVIRGGVNPGADDLSGLEANLKVTRILDAARKSAATGQTVKLR